MDELTMGEGLEGLEGHLGVMWWLVMKVGLVLLSVGWGWYFSFVFYIFFEGCKFKGFLCLWERIPHLGPVVARCVFE